VEAGEPPYGGQMSGVGAFVLCFLIPIEFLAISDKD